MEYSIDSSYVYSIERYHNTIEYYDYYNTLYCTYNYTSLSTQSILLLVKIERIKWDAA